MTRENNISTCPYRYSDTSIHGFIGTHQPAVGFLFLCRIYIYVGLEAYALCHIPILFMNDHNI